MAKIISQSNMTFNALNNISNIQNRASRNQVNFQALQQLSTQRSKYIQDILDMFGDESAKPYRLPTAVPAGTPIASDIVEISPAAQDIRNNLPAGATAADVASAIAGQAGADIAPAAYVRPAAGAQPAIVETPGTADAGGGSATMPGAAGAAAPGNEVAAAQVPSMDLSSEAREAAGQMLDIINEMGELTAQSASLKTDDAQGREVVVTDEMRAANQERFANLRQELQQLATENDFGSLAAPMKDALQQLEGVDISTRSGGQEAVGQVFDTLNQMKEFFPGLQPQETAQPASPAQADETARDGTSFYVKIIYKPMDKNVYYEHVTFP